MAASSNWGCPFVDVLRCILYRVHILAANLWNSHAVSMQSEEPYPASTAIKFGHQAGYPIANLRM